MSTATHLLFRNCGCTAQEKFFSCSTTCPGALAAPPHTYMTSLNLIFIFVNFEMVPKHCLCQLYKQLLSRPCLTLSHAQLGHSSAWLRVGHCPE